ncbi:hypothetical protein BOX15_Mlig003641g1 [Macrostomum lignano]|uniref:Uncharacterized protein n=1 Tax=Macrostomum lignano TaxID=282301 RepID=A0A267DKN7_9PLAT|nr:hypothetical protein BOX15_Mlig003641g1 [Macrostomum lignano]
MSHQQPESTEPSVSPAATPAATAFGMDGQTAAEHGKYVQLNNIVSDDEDPSSDYVLEDVSQKKSPIAYARLFNVGPNRPPIDYYWLCVASLIVQLLLAPYLFLMELGCGMNLALRAIQSCRYSRSYFARSEFELAALTAFKAGRYAGGSLLLSALTAALAAAFILPILLVQPQPETSLDFHIISES